MEKLDYSEQTRTEEKTREIRKDISLSVLSIFKNSSVAKAFERPNQFIIQGFDREILPNMVPFSDKIVAEICPTCSCTRSPNLLLPYLERKLVIPVLGASYSFYPPNFIEAIYGYPHLSAEEFHAARELAWGRTSAQLFSKNQSLSLIKQYWGLAKKNRIAYEGYEEGTSDIGTVLTNMQPFLHEDNGIIEELDETLRKRDQSKFQKILYLSYLIRGLRTSQVFNLIPQLKISQLESLESLRYHEEYGETGFEVADARDSIMKGLRLSYDPSVPLETYLDIVCERKQKIRSIVNDILDKAKMPKETFLSNLQKEIEQMNEEVNSIKSSNKARIIELVTAFTSQNKSIIAGTIAGISMGIGGLGLVGCGAGVVSGLATEVLSRARKISLPSEVSAVTKRLSTRLEPHYEKLLATSLSANINAIQLWQLRRRIDKQRSIDQGETRPRNPRHAKN